MVAVFIIIGIFVCCCIGYCIKQGVFNLDPTPLQTVQPVSKTVGPQTQETQSINIAEQPPNTCGGEIKLKSFNHGYGDSISRSKYSAPRSSYPDTWDV